MKQLKWTKTDQNKVIKVVKEALDILNMNSWTVYNNFMNESEERRGSTTGEEFVTSALNTVTQEYEKIIVNWYPSFLIDIRDGNDNLVRETVYHELLHGLTSEIYNLSLDRFVTELECKEAIERLTQRMTKIICSVT